MTENMVPSTPEPDWNTLVGALVRAVIQLAAGLGFYHGAVNDGVVTMVTTGVVAIGTIAWSLWQKYKAAQNNHAGAVQSAVEGVPVKAA